MLRAGPACEGVTAKLPCDVVMMECDLGALAQRRDCNISGFHGMVMSQLTRPPLPVKVLWSGIWLWILNTDFSLFTEMV